MKKILLIMLFMLATLAWAAAAQAGSPMGQSGVPSTPPGGQAPSTSPSQPGVPGNGAPGSADQTGSAPITEGCLGGSAPNFTITDKTGTTYKLNIPSGANTAPLSQHIGESVQVEGVVTSGSNPAIDARRIGKGTGTCAGAKGAPKQ
jgi:hypothetical protein